MTPAKPTNFAEYLALAPPEKRAALKKLRSTIKAGAPGAEEVFSYGIPGFRFQGKPLIWFAAWKDHYSLYPITQELLDEHAGHGHGYSTSKGTVRFPASETVPYDLVATLVRARIQALAQAK